MKICNRHCQGGHGFTVTKRRDKLVEGRNSNLAHLPYLLTVFVVFFFGSWSAHKCADHELPALQDLLKGEKTSNYERENESNYKIPGLDCIPCIGTNSFVRRKLFRLEFGNWNSKTVAYTCTIGTNVFQKSLHQNILTKETNSSSFRVKILFEGIP